MSLLSFWKKYEQDTVPQRILERLEHTPDRLCARVHSGNTTHSISYRRLAEGAAPYAVACAKAKLSAGDRVVVMQEQGPDLLYAFFGAIFAGAVPAILAPPSPRQDPSHFWRGHREVMERIRAQLLFTTPKLKIDLQSILADHDIVAVTPEDLPSTSKLPTPDTHSQDVAFLQHSSGTTGTKKGVMISHAALLHQVDAYATRLCLDEKDHMVSWLPLYHDMGLIACCLLPILRGVPVTMISPFEWTMRPSSLLDLIERTKATLVWQPNFAFQHLINCVRPDDNWDLSSVRAFIDCSERCRPETLDQFASKFAPMGLKKGALQTCYAMAETVFAVTQSEPGIAPRTETIDAQALIDDGVARPTLDVHAATKSVLSCGTPIDDLSVLIMDDEGNRLPDRRIGEICVSGPCLARGYDRQPEKSCLVFREGWYHTRDLGYLSNGELFVTGRVDDLLILNGRNHYAHDLEFALRDTSGIIPGRVIALSEYRSDLGSDALIVLAETRESDPAALQKIKKNIRDRMLDETGLIPAAIHLFPPMWLIKSTSGKISREATNEKFRSPALEDELT
ncbi:AMP-binding protein [Parvibaculaceae bacterium PLY_AMNH_Bact1]|nr:AMP-binding protein [Parvibaculaceae bacterium PLY_AMNH_Bact1]